MYVCATYRGIHEKGTRSYLCELGIDRLYEWSLILIRVPFIWNQLFYTKIFFNFLLKTSGRWHPVLPGDQGHQGHAHGTFRNTLHGITTDFLCKDVLVWNTLQAITTDFLCKDVLVLSSVLVRKPWVKQFINSLLDT